MIQKSSIQRVAELFFKEPSKKHYLKEISRKLGIAHTSVKNNLNKLKSENFIIEYIEIKGERKFPTYKANFNNIGYRTNKIKTNIALIIESELVKYLVDNIMPKSIILFGSYLRGEDIEESDIDIFIEGKKENIRLDKFENILGRKIQLHFKDNFKKYPKELKNNIANGFVLYGYLKVY